MWSSSRRAGLYQRGQCSPQGWGSGSPCFLSPPVAATGGLWIDRVNQVRGEVGRWGRGRDKEMALAPPPGRVGSSPSPRPWPQGQEVPPQLSGRRACSWGLSQEEAAGGQPPPGVRAGLTPFSAGIRHQAPTSAGPRRPQGCRKGPPEACGRGGRLRVPGLHPGRPWPSPRPGCPPRSAPSTRDTRARGGPRGAGCGRRRDSGPGLVPATR